MLFEFTDPQENTVVFVLKKKKYLFFFEAIGNSVL